MKILTKCTLLLLLSNLLTLAPVPFEVSAQSKSTEAQTIEQLLLPEAESTTDESASPPSASADSHADDYFDLSAKLTPEAAAPSLDWMSLPLIGGPLALIVLLAILADKAWDKHEAYEREQQTKQSQVDTK